MCNRCTLLVPDFLTINIEADDRLIRMAHDFVVEEEAELNTREGAAASEGFAACCIKEINSSRTKVAVNFS